MYQKVEYMNQRRSRKNFLWNTYIKTKSITDHLSFVNCFEKY